MIAFGGHTDLARFAEIVAWGTVAGSFLQFSVQLPQALRLLGSFRPALDWRLPQMRQVIEGFLPALIGRGVVQISAFVDLAYASLVTDRAIAVLSFAQNLYLLPVSLFGMSVSAAELPAMSQVRGEGSALNAELRKRLGAGLERIAFFVVPSAAAFLALGDVVAGALFQSGRFTPADTRYAWYVLMGSGVGTARRDQRTPVRLRVLRIEGHAHASVLRDRACFGRRRARAVCRQSVAAPARRAHGARSDRHHARQRHRFMGRIPAASPRPGAAHR